MDLLLAAALALTAAIVAMETASMLVRQSEAARECRDGAYAFAARVEEAIAGSGGAAEGRMGWREGGR